jgi:phosphorylcholine metabolism protein LicD
MQTLVLGFVGRFMKLEKILKKQEKTSTRFRNCNSSKYCITNFPIRSLKHRYDAKDFDESVRLELHGDKFNCPKGYHNILTKYYGDYMTPPKKEDRVAIHISEEK